MFIVLNRSRINSYLISIGTVIILFSMSFMVNKNMDFVETIASIQEKTIYSVDIKEKKVALTINCDKNINADDIDKILDTLSKYKIHITFFITNDCINKYEEAVKKIFNEGHEIGSLSNNDLSLEENINKIEKIIGKKPYFYRFLGEYNNNNSIGKINIKNHLIVQWNMNILNYIGKIDKEKEEIYGKMKNDLNPGSIILMQNENEKITDALDMLIYSIKNEGYDIVKVSDLIYKDNYYIDINGVQRQITSNNENNE